LTLTSTNNTSTALIYITHYSREEVISLLNAYFHRTLHSAEKHIRTSGIIKNDREFEIRSKWEITFAKPPYKNNPLAIGKLVPVSEGTEVRIFLIRRRAKWPWILSLALLPLYLMIYGIFMETNYVAIFFGILSLFFLIDIYFSALKTSHEIIIKGLTKELKLERQSPIKKLF